MELFSEGFGKNDGTVDGVRYFSCKKMHGIFVRPNHLSKAKVLPVVFGPSEESSRQDKSRVEPLRDRPPPSSSPFRRVSVQNKQQSRFYQKVLTMTTTTTIIIIMTTNHTTIQQIQKLWKWCYRVHYLRHDYNLVYNHV